MQFLGITNLSCNGMKLPRQYFFRPISLRNCRYVTSENHTIVLSYSYVDIFFMSFIDTQWD